MSTRKLLLIVIAGLILATFAGMQAMSVHATAVAGQNGNVAQQDKPPAKFKSLSRICVDEVAGECYERLVDCEAGVLIYDKDSSYGGDVAVPLNTTKLLDYCR